MKKVYHDPFARGGIKTDSEPTPTTKMKYVDDMPLSTKEQWKRYRENKKKK